MKYGNNIEIKLFFYHEIMKLYITRRLNLSPVRRPGSELSSSDCSKHSIGREEVKLRRGMENTDDGDNSSNRGMMDWRWIGMVPGITTGCSSYLQVVVTLAVCNGVVFL